jgi:hypothetical protein
LIYYAILTSLSRGINRIRNLNDQAENNRNFSPIEERNSTSSIPYYSEKIKISSWAFIEQTLPIIIIWIIFGFATGFLIGLIIPK